jgi:hypothetical protein
MVPFPTQSSFVQFSSTQYVSPKTAHSWLYSLVFAIEILETYDVERQRDDDGYSYNEIHNI